MSRFVDQAVVRVEAGRGGNGVHSHYRDMWTRHPVPDGGNGGRGGDVIVQANPQLSTLLDFQTQRHFRAGSGGNGSSKRQMGARGSDCILQVPLGTLVYDDDSQDLIREILRPGDSVVVAKGGAGGVGNGSRARSKDLHVKHSTEFLEGAAGEKRRLRFELKLLADVGIIGMPNAGKSTLIGQISKARPKVASFPFTTLQPVLGSVHLPTGVQIVAVDVPGLIRGAHEGRGLGLGFLRHIERTRVLIHLIDMAASDGQDPVEDYHTLREELKSYQPAILKKPVVVAANKMDCPEAERQMKRFRQHVKVSMVPISAKTGQGVPELLKAVSKKLTRGSRV
ncbi:MAG: GTPase ObgE [Candidatus Omnitrophica bacterium]|nr:GTPase ObgE [Candidatus Omnitrophota bacterium]